MENINNNLFFNKLIYKNFKNGYKYKFYKNFIKIFKIIFLLKKKYEFDLNTQNYIYAINYDIQNNLPLFTKKKRGKKLYTFPLYKQKKIIEIYKWIVIILFKNKFRSLIFRVAFFFINLFISDKYNIINSIHQNVLRNLKKKYTNKKIKYSKLGYLGDINNVKCFIH